MHFSTTFAFFSLVALALLIPSSAAPSCDCDSGTSSVIVKSKNAASSSDVKASQASKSAVVSEAGGVKYASGAEKSSYSEDKDSASVSQQEFTAKNKDGSIYKAKKSASQSSSVDVDKSSSSSFTKVAGKAC